MEMECVIYHIYVETWTNIINEYSFFVLNLFNIYIN